MTGNGGKRVKLSRKAQRHAPTQDLPKRKLENFLKKARCMWYYGWINRIEGKILLLMREKGFCDKTAAISSQRGFFKWGAVIMRQKG
ncbi:hypothetical protein D1B31_06965 [Neobacillus notoginsengisoli]|uniref:Uncharacterized protein n=1 Tax=Neobacillus notoginsengisoli TaxID=1578198 RepID=A0A417YVQ3_9BACI|nr:hypothetical protein D1B31_06965 [Neobacillus notoginsengisoli]